MEPKRESRFRRFCTRHAFRPRSVVFVILLVLLVTGALGFFSAQGMLNVSKTTAFGLKDIGELATQAGYFTTVQTISKARDLLGWKIPLTESNYVYSYDGTIKAGLDFSDIRMEVDDLRHVIRITFPEFRILSTEIRDDSFVLYNDGKNPFTSLSVDDVHRSNAQLKEDARRTALKNGILENARANAELLVRGFLAGVYDLSVYSIEFLPEKEGTP